MAKSKVKPKAKPVGSTSTNTTILRHATRDLDQASRRDAGPDGVASSQGSAQAVAAPDFFRRIRAGIVDFGPSDSTNDVGSCAAAVVAAPRSLKWFSTNDSTAETPR